MWTFINVPRDEMDAVEKHYQNLGAELMQTYRDELKCLVDKAVKENYLGDNDDGTFTFKPAIWGCPLLMMTNVDKAFMDKHYPPIAIEWETIEEECDEWMRWDVNFN